MFEWCSSPVMRTSSPAPTLLPAVGLGHEVDGLGGAAQQHDLPGLGGPEEALHPGPGLLVGVGGEHRELVHAPVDVGVVALVDVALGVDHRLRLLGAGRAVEVDEGLAVDRDLQHRELAADGLHVQGRGGAGTGPGRGAHAIASLTRAAPPRRACSWPSTASRSDGTGEAVDEVAGEGPGEEAPRLRLPDPAGAEVEERRGVELAGGRAVPALDVVGQDLELGHRVDEGLGGEEQVPVHLLGVGLLGPGAHQHQAVEDAAAAAVEDPLVELAARAVGPGVVDAGVGVGEAGAVDHEQAVEDALPALALEADVDVVAADGGPEAERVVGEAGVAAEAGRQRGHVEGLLALQLQLVVIDEGVVLERRPRSPRWRGRRSPPGPVKVSTIRLSLPRPATTSTREYDAAVVPPAVATCTIAAGSSTTAPGATKTTAASAAKAVLRSAKALASSPWARSRCGSSRSGSGVQELAQAVDLQPVARAVEASRARGDRRPSDEDDAGPSTPGGTSRPRRVRARARRRRPAPSGCG